MTDEDLINHLTNGLARVDTGSVGAGDFRRYVARVDLLPVVKRLLAEELHNAADAIESVWEGIEESGQPYTPGHAARQLRARATYMEPSS